MRNISFALTIRQFNDGTKDVTRRLGWRFLKPGDRLMGCEKCQGIKKGGLVRLGEIEVVHVSRQRLDMMVDHPKWGDEEAVREGFPEMTGTEFVEMFCENMGCKPDAVVTRIEFRRVGAGKNQVLRSKDREPETDRRSQTADDRELAN